MENFRQIKCGCKSEVPLVVSHYQFIEKLDLKQSINRTEKSPEWTLHSSENGHKKRSRYTPRTRLRMYSSCSFLTSALDGGEWSASRPGSTLPPGKGPSGTRCTGGWEGPRACLDTEVTGKILSPLPGIEPRSPGRPVRSQTLYWLSYLRKGTCVIHLNRSVPF
jgi:hypothetical protein